MTQRKDQSKHDSVVKTLAQNLKNDGFTNIKADIKGYDQPDLLYWNNDRSTGHIPDIAAEKAGEKYLIEVETEDTVSSEQTISQWKLFSANAKQHNKNFSVVVPEQSEQEATQVLRNNGMGAEILTY